MKKKCSSSLCLPLYHELIKYHNKSPQCCAVDVPLTSHVTTGSESGGKECGHRSGCGGEQDPWSLDFYPNVIRILHCFRRKSNPEPFCTVSSSWFPIAQQASTGNSILIFCFHVCRKLRSHLRAHSKQDSTLVESCEAMETFTPIRR